MSPIRATCSQKKRPKNGKGKKSGSVPVQSLHLKRCRPENFRSEYALLEEVAQEPYCRRGKQSPDKDQQMKSMEGWQRVAERIKARGYAPLNIPEERKHLRNLQKTYIHSKKKGRTVWMWYRLFEDFRNRPDDEPFLGMDHFVDREEAPAKSQNLETADSVLEIIGADTYSIGDPPPVSPANPPPRVDTPTCNTANSPPRPDSPPINTANSPPRVDSPTGSTASSPLRADSPTGSTAPEAPAEFQNQETVFSVLEIIGADTYSIGDPPPISPPNPPPRVDTPTCNTANSPPRPDSPPVNTANSPPRVGSPTGSTANSPLRADSPTGSTANLPPRVDSTPVSTANLPPRVDSPPLNTANLPPRVDSSVPPSTVKISFEPFSHPPKGPCNVNPSFIIQDATPIASQHRAEFEMFQNYQSALKDNFLLRNQLLGEKSKVAHLYTIQLLYGKLLDLAVRNLEELQTFLAINLTANGIWGMPIDRFQPGEVKKIQDLFQLGDETPSVIAKQGDTVLLTLPGTGPCQCNSNPHSSARRVIKCLEAVTIWKCAAT